MSDITEIMLEDFGVLTEPGHMDDVTYDLRAISRYCEDRHVEPSSLSPEELASFTKLDEQPSR